MIEHNRFFTDNDLLDEEIRTIAKYILNEDTNDVIVKKYSEKIAIFLEEHHPITLIDHTNSTSVKLLLFNYWYILLVYQKNTTWKEGTRTKYINSAIRIIEFIIFVCSINSDRLQRLFFSVPKDTVLFLHFQKILESIDEKKFTIAFDKNNEVYLSENESYKSVITTQPGGESSRNMFTFYFMLDNHQITNMYNIEKSKNSIDGRNPKGGNWKRTPFMDKEEYLEQLLPFDVKDKGKENSIEFESRKKKIVPLDLEDASLIFGELDQEKTPNLKKINFSSPYKRYLINKAIGQSISKQNLSLRSKYNIPDIEILSSMFGHMIKEESLSANLIFLTVVFGIKTEKLIYAVSGFDSHIRLNKRDSKLKIDSLGKIKVFAAYEIDNEIAKNSDKKEVEICLPQIIVRVWEETRRLLSEKYNYALKRMMDTYNNTLELNEILDKDIAVSQKHQKVLEVFEDYKVEKEDLLILPPQITKEIEDESREFLKKHVDDFSKNVTLKYQTLPLLFLHLFKTRKQESDIHLLFSGVMNKNDEARLCYASVPSRLLHYESWQIELIALLGLDVTLDEKYSIQTRRNSTPFVQTDQWFGSRLYIKGTYFQKFLLDLLSLRFENEIDQINAKMIFLKYMLSCLMGARDFTASLSMAQYSKREQMLFIQEKGKNLFSSKRIIPLTSNGVSLVEKFLQLKKAHKIESYYPCFIKVDSENNREEIVMNRSNIVAWLKEKTTDDNQDIIANILRFSEYTPLNFGRHIFTSYAIQSSTLQSQYIEAFLNHYKMGKEDQGVYSHFDNQDYFRQIRKVLQEIERIYIPSVWEKLW